MTKSGVFSDSGIQKSFRIVLTSVDGVFEVCSTLEGGVEVRRDSLVMFALTKDMAYEMGSSLQDMADYLEEL